MFRNYLVIALRNLSKNKGLTAINVLGLSIGMACVMLIGLFIHYEFSYDRYNVNADRIYRVFREAVMENGTEASSRASGALATALKQDFPEVQLAVRAQVLEAWINSADNRFFQQTLCVADREILDMFTIPFVQGDPKTVLDGDGSMVLTESMARKYFGNENPIGKILNVDETELSGTYFVSGVVRDFPKNSTFRFDCLTATPRGSLKDSWTQWQPTGSYRPFLTFVMLPRGYDYRRLERKLPDLIVRHMGEDIAKIVRYRLQPLTRTHLYTGVDFGRFGDPGTGSRQVEYGDIKQVYAFGLVAVFILLLACVNFMNLSTARSTGRAREVGLRKVVGAFHKQLIAQFLGESVLVALVALVVAGAMVELVLPWFNAFVQRDMALQGRETLWWILLLIGFGLGVGLLAGAYPAFVLSAFAPTQVMKGDWTPGSKRAWLRKGLVVFQFAFSIVFITGTIVVQRQLAYVRNKDLGFDKERVVGMPIFWVSRQIHHNGKGDLRGRYRMVKEAFLRHPNVLKATVTRFPQGDYITTDTYWAEGSQTDWQMGVFDVDEDYLDFFGIDLVAGRMPDESDLRPPMIQNQDGSVAIDRNKIRQFIERGTLYLLNETAVRQLGWDVHGAIGKRFGPKLSRNGGFMMGNGHVVGVVKDFHVQSLHHEIRPVVFTVGAFGAKHLYLKLGPGDLSGTLAFLKETWHRFLPEAPFAYYFLDEALTRTRYENEIRTGQVLAVFSGLTIFVACLGLFGLIAYRVEQKTKEIGIRKVMGASSGSIFALLSREFVALVGVASVIACPIAFVMVRRWLQDFAYRIDLSAGVFLLGGVLALLIALATISYQALKAARANPVTALRYE